MIDVFLSSNSQLKLTSVKQLCSNLQKITKDTYNVICKSNDTLHYDTPEQPYDNNILESAMCRNDKLMKYVLSLDTISNKVIIISLENGIEENDNVTDVCKLVITELYKKSDNEEYDKKTYTISSFGIEIDNIVYDLYKREKDMITFGKFLNKYFGVETDNWMADSRFGGINRNEQFMNCLNKYLLMKFTDIIPNYPRNGVMFKHISSVFAEPILLNILFDLLEHFIKNNFDVNKIDYFAGLDARGFYFAPYLSKLFGKGFIPIRKSNKIPPHNIYEVYTNKYSTEYSNDEFAIECRKQYLSTDVQKNVVLIDDLLATGGSLIGATILLTNIGMNVLGSVTIYHVPELSNRTANLFEVNNHKNYVLLHECGLTTEKIKLTYKVSEFVHKKINDDNINYERKYTLTDEQWNKSVENIHDLDEELEKVKFIFTDKDKKLAWKILLSLRLLKRTAYLTTYVNNNIVQITNGQFSNGERRIKIDTSIRNYHVIIVCQTRTGFINDDFMELIMIMDACKRAGVSKITVVLPYYPYARSDKKDDPRCPIGASVIAKIIKNMDIDNLISLDLHAGQIQGYIDSGFHNLYIKRYACDYLYNNYLKFYDHVQWNELFVFVAPDTGCGKTIKGYSEILGINNIIMDKQRNYSVPGTILSSRYCGDSSLLKNKTVIIIDDMADTMGTMCSASNELVNSGAKDVIILVTHGVLSGESINRINSTQCIKEVIVTDTLPQDNNLVLSPKIRLLSCGELIARTLDGILTGKSISRLF